MDEVTTGPVLAGALCLRARRRPISKGGRGIQIILKKVLSEGKIVDLTEIS
jgi:hypothetical protein